METIQRGQSLHAKILITGLPHGIEKFEKSYDQLDVPGGKVKLRPIKIYDCTFPKEAYPWFLREFYSEKNQKDDMPVIKGAPFKSPKRQIKVGRIKKVIWFFMDTIGKLFGYRSPDYQKIDLTKPKEGPSGQRQNIHIIVLGVADDNFIWNSAHEKWVDWI